MGDHEHRGCAGGGREEPVPHLVLGVDVERAREVVDHEQLGPAHEGPGGRGALDLAARQPHALRSDDGVEAVGHLGEVLVEAGAVERLDEVVVVEAQQDRVGHALAEQPRHLRQVGGPRRHEERRPVVDRPAVPPDRAGVGIDQPEQRAQQGGLARADGPGHHRERAALEVEVDRCEAAAGEGDGEAFDVEALQPEVVAAAAGRDEGVRLELAGAVAEVGREGLGVAASGRGRAAARPAGPPTRRPGAGRRRAAPPSGGGRPAP